MKVKSMENTLNGKGVAIQKSKKSPSPSLNTENKNLFTYNYNGLVLSLLGGLNDNRLDSLTVMLRIEDDNQYKSFCHKVNLYNTIQLKRYVKQAQENCGFSATQSHEAIQSLIKVLEDYRFEKLDIKEEEPEEAQLLPEGAQKEALELLESPDLLSKTNNLIGSSGIVGEENNRLLMYLIFTSRKTNKPLQCISFGPSGSGKTYLQSKVAKLIPNEDKVEITQLTATALYYFKQYELKQKLLLIEDLDGVGDALLPLRELQTKGRITKSVTLKGVGGRGRAYNQTVEGPVCVAGTTTSHSMYEDNANRSFLLYIDTSPEQDERIMEYQCLESANSIDIDKELEAARLLRNAQRMLRPIRVVNEFARYLRLPNTVFKPRRTNMHYLQLIEIITFYHQFQREKHYDEMTGEQYIKTTVDDIKLANTLIKDVLLRKSDRLNGATRNHFERLKIYLKTKNATTFSNQEIRRAFRLNEAAQRRYRNLLEQEGYIKSISKDKKRSYTYELLEVDEYKNLEKTIEEALQRCLDNIPRQ